MAVRHGLSLELSQIHHLRGNLCSALMMVAGTLLYLEGARASLEAGLSFSFGIRPPLDHDLNHGADRLEQNYPGRISERDQAQKKAPPERS